ncbi:MAG: CRISPR-associated endoribonuclease Cas6 [Nanoarchaeota archaeon]
MNGYIYKILASNKDLASIHEGKKFKGFCFGNIYPVKDRQIKENCNYNLVLSSPIPKIIEHLFFNIKEDCTINLGEGSFNVEGIEVRNFVLNNKNIIETLSIINLTKHTENKILPLLYDENKEEFLNQLSINLIRKYNHLRQKEIGEDFKLFENIEIGLIKNNHKLKHFSIPILLEDNKRFNAIGNKLYFKFNRISDEQLAIFQVCLDAGFGERNSFGMGFMVKK